jgi:PAP2 superfamily
MSEIVQTRRQTRRSLPVASRFGSIPELDRIARNSRIIWSTIAAMAGATVLAFWLARLSFAWPSAGAIAIWVITFLSVSCLYRRFRPDPAIVYGTECGAQLALIFLLSCAITYPLATAGFPYRDAALNAVDTWMGLDWRAYLRFLNERPALGNLARLAYGSVLLQSVLLIGCLVVASQLIRMQQYIFATAIALIVTMTVFTFVPAGGIYTFLGVSADEFANLSPVMTTDQIVKLDALRSGRQTLVDDMAGLVTFPSFHSAWGVLFIWGFYPIRVLRYVAIVLNGFMIATTPIQGAHYFIDLVGGVAVACAAIHIAVRMMGRMELNRNEPAARQAVMPAIV